jgi:pectinesterase
MGIFKKRFSRILFFVPVFLLGWCSVYGIEKSHRLLSLTVEEKKKSVHETMRSASTGLVRFPADNAKDVNPDTHLVLAFQSVPTLGNSGTIRVFDAADDRLVDVLDLSLPPGPTSSTRTPAPYTPIPYEYNSVHSTNANTKPGTPSGIALPTSDTCQLTIIGGFTDAFHFYPVIIHDTAATIYLHNNLLKYDKKYYVHIDPGVLTLSDGSFTGISGKTGWRFTTKKTPPPVNSERLVVDGDGTGDFNTVQGAIDFIPDNNPRRVTIFIKNGTYEEIVYFRNKANITFLGEDREKVVVCYANNEVFNPHPSNVATNEIPGTFPSRRAAFMGDHSTGIHLVNFTIKSINDKPAQAEGLLLMGTQNIACHVTIEGSGDALQVNGSVYMTDCKIYGYGDNILGRGPAFFDHCELISTFGPYMWIRNTSSNHGNVFVNCRFRTRGNVETVIARAPINKGKGYPFSEAVLLNCSLAGISPEGWGPVGDTSNIHYWEYNSTNISDGTPVDVSKRSTYSRQLTKIKDAEIIDHYSHPTYVLGGWTPSMPPIIITQPVSITRAMGQTANFRVQVAAVPTAAVQWFKNGKAIDGATNETLHVENLLASDDATYTVSVKNCFGSVTSQAATLTVK